MTAPTILTGWKFKPSTIPSRVGLRRKLYLSAYAVKFYEIITVKVILLNCPQPSCDNNIFPPTIDSSFCDCSHPARHQEQFRTVKYPNRTQSYRRTHSQSKACEPCAGNEWDPFPLLIAQFNSYIKASIAVGMRCVLLISCPNPILLIPLSLSHNIPVRLHCPLNWNN